VQIAKRSKPHTFAVTPRQWVVERSFAWLEKFRRLWKNNVGYHFILLDAIGITPTREFDAIIDPTQLAWLRQDLAATRAGTPIIRTSHLPVVSAVTQYAPTYTGNTTPALHTYLLRNAHQVLPLFEGHNLIAVLQGHVHLNETVYWRNIPFIASRAVCGNWWKSSLLGAPEDLTVFELYQGTARWRH
jgi:Icc protein